MNWLSFLFQTDSGRFQWVGISAFVAAVGLCINAYQNRRKFKADLISQSRIKWIEMARTNMAEYLSVMIDSYVKAINSASSYTKWKVAASQKGNYSKELKAQYNADNDIYNAAISEKNKQYNNLLLLFNPSQENKTILKSINDFNQLHLNMVRTIQSKADEAVQDGIVLKGNDLAMNPDVQKVVRDFYEASESLRDESRLYFQEEWNKSQKGN